MHSSDFLPVTGTFLDGVACDIPANNWTRKIWHAALEEQKAMGFDTLIVIRVGWRKSAMYDSKVMQCTLFDQDDLLEFILSEADSLGMKVFVGLFNSGKYWIVNDWQQTSAKKGRFAKCFISVSPNADDIYAQILQKR